MGLQTVNYILCEGKARLGGPDKRGSKAKYPLLAFAEWILSDWPYHHQQDPQIRQKASEILRQNESEPEQSQEVESIDLETEQGLEGALARLRTAEQRTYQLWIESLYNGSPNQNLFRTWKESVDLLRKAESNLLEVLEKRRDLLPADEVKVWLTRQIETAKSTLLDLPGKLAPGLENLPWQEIQKSLDAEIRHAISKLSDLPK